MLLDMIPLLCHSARPAEQVTTHIHQHITLDAVPASDLTTHVAPDTPTTPTHFGTNSLQTEPKETTQTE